MHLSVASTCGLARARGCRVAERCPPLRPTAQGQDTPLLAATRRVSATTPPPRIAMPSLDPEPHAHFFVCVGIETQLVAVAARREGCIHLSNII
mmetsp:Transcript_53483/g.106419  ORF Transcript_53483/g.106419 Transcript_53483/m.106419 type:complete len:94 (-) Transcript_53483:601-882(-)